MSNDTLPKQHPTYPHKAALAEKLVYADDGVIYINGIHKRDLDVQTEIANIRRSSTTEVSVQFVMLSQIEAIYGQDPSLIAKTANNPQDSQTNRQEYLIRLMRTAAHKGASDIHMVVGGSKTKIQFRIHGELHLENETTTEEGEFMMSALYNSMIDSSSDSDFNRGKRQQGRLRKEFAAKAGVWSARLATTPAESGVAMALRLLYKRRSGRPSTAQLGYLPEQVAILNETKRRGKGICIFSGSTGSGKSTTLECLLSEYSLETGGRRRVLTIEHPVEFPIEGAVQTPIIDRNGADDDGVAAEFASSITHSMRLDPDIMMVGEVRSVGSARAAFAAAMTGHGMYTTLHANDWLTVFDRLRDLGITDSLLYDPTLVRCLVNQSLARTLCPHCRIKFSDHSHQVDDALGARIERFCTPDTVYLRGPGCDKCLGGINGRTVVAEVCSPTRGLMEAYQKSKFAAYDYWKAHGGITKCSHLTRRINEGLIDPAMGELDVCLLDTDELLMA
ncbi:GspE/PulE family protein [Castellaniella sp.]|uniref:GspE/PulE family protein n=1 Tax=Castellaniella sp. TaxID=1955812 RepID=UPI002AFE2D4F|nr:ATPase, T2SS/T4P/T4SS family [Castellaniella sp.]